MKLKKIEKLRKEFDNEFNEGFMLTDLTKYQWKLGELIGKGGFGNVYSVYPIIVEPNINYQDCSVKIEPYSNGPLFTEIAFYQRVATYDKIQKWIRDKKIDFLGIPHYISTGFNSNSNKPHRFIIIPRLGTSIETIWLNYNKSFSPGIVYQIGYKLLECLQYMHHFGYSHGDLKLSNLMTGYRESLDKCHVYLMDFGLVTSFLNDKNHRKYIKDPKRKHDGTIEYNSLDAHDGVIVSRRGDLCNLCFLLLHLLLQDLPWISLINDKDKVYIEKSKFMSNPKVYLMNLGLPTLHLDGLLLIIDLLNKLNYEDNLKYDQIFQIFNDQITKYCSTSDIKIFKNGYISFTKNHTNNCNTIHPESLEYSQRRNPIRNCRK